MKQFYIDYWKGRFLVKHRGLFLISIQYNDTYVRFDDCPEDVKESVVNRLQDSIAASNEPDEHL